MPRGLRDLPILARNILNVLRIRMGRPPGVVQGNGLICKCSVKWFESSV